MRINFLLALAFISFISYANIDYLHGIVGMTLRDGGIGCICHNFSPDNSVTVWIEGPDSVIRNSTQQYRILMTGGPAIAGGFNIASFSGMVDPEDTLTQLLFGELTHTFPNQFINDTVSWNFLYTAPDSIIIDTIYSVGNSVNYDSIPSAFDKWNFGENFAIHIIDNPVNVAEEISTLKNYNLIQNYPNPFNPTTTITYEIESEGLITLTLYNTSGEEIAILVNETKQPGYYSINFDGSSLSSGIYFYQLKTNTFVETKKMVLMK